MSENNTQSASSFDEMNEADEIYTIYLQTLDEGGSSRLVMADGRLSDELPTHGYMVAITDAFQDGISTKVNWPYILDVLSEDEEFDEAYRKLHEDIMNVYKAYPWTTGSLFMGTWYNERTEQIEIEASVHIKDFSSAMFLAHSTNQFSIFDLQNHKSITACSVKFPS